MNSLFKKIALRISLLFLIVIILSVLGSILYLNNSYYKNTEKELLLRAGEIEQAMKSGADVTRFVQGLAELSGIRVTVINTDGKVGLDTEADAETLDNHIQRPEIQDAINYGTGVSIRHSDTLGVDLMYAAIYSESENIFIRVALPLDGVSAYSASFWLPLVSVLIMSFLLCLAISLFVSRRVVRPVIELKEYTGKIADGEYEGIRKLKTGDEIEELSGALSDMAGALKRNIEDITEKSTRLQAVFKAVPGGILSVDRAGKVIMANPAAVGMFSIHGSPEGKHYLEVVKHPKLETVIKDAFSAKKVIEREITLQKGMEEIFLQVFAVSVVSDGADYGVILLAQDITRIKKLENIRSEFAANVSHELKTPLTVISGFIDTLKDPAISKSDADRFLDIISIESERLTRLIDDILLLSEIENTTVRPAAVIDIREGVKEAVELLQSKANDKGLELSFETYDEEILVAAEKDRIKQMVINLVDNAIKYTPSGGSVEVSITKDEVRGIISVSDTGIGIPADNIPRLFERFYRVDKSRSRALGGTGLGLAIVKHIVSLIGGHITVKSTVGKGSRFDIYLPVKGE